jgi:hypothetical protein
MIDAILVIVVTAILGSLLVPVLVLALARIGLFPPVTITFWRSQVVFAPSIITSAKPDRLYGGMDQSQYKAVHDPDIRITRDFDAVDDVLYISLGEPVESYVEDEQDSIFFRRSYQTNDPSGVTIVPFRAWQGRLPELATAIASYLRVSERAIEAEISNVT